MNTNLNHACTALAQATSDFFAAVGPELRPAQQDAMQALLSGGGRVGLDVLADGHGAIVIRVIGVEREGSHVVLATLTPPVAGAVQ